VTQQEIMSKPGTKMTMQDPMLEKDAFESSIPVAPPVMTFLAEAGDTPHVSVDPFIPTKTATRLNMEQNDTPRSKLLLILKEEPYSRLDSSNTNVWNSAVMTPGERNYSKCFVC
jgi:hypothetical protein